MRMKEHVYERRSLLLHLIHSPTTSPIAAREPRMKCGIDDTDILAWFSNSVPAAASRRTAAMVRLSGCDFERHPTAHRVTHQHRVVDTEGLQRTDGQSDRLVEVDRWKGCCLAVGSGV
jgi:hypothetical protein